MELICKYCDRVIDESECRVLADDRLGVLVIDQSGRAHNLVSKRPQTKAQPADGLAGVSAMPAPEPATSPTDIMADLDAFMNESEAA